MELSHHTRCVKSSNYWYHHKPSLPPLTNPPPHSSLVGYFKSSVNGSLHDSKHPVPGGSAGETDVQETTERTVATPHCFHIVLLPGCLRNTFVLVAETKLGQYLWRKVYCYIHTCRLLVGVLFWQGAVPCSKQRRSWCVRLSLRSAEARVHTQQLGSCRPRCERTPPEQEVKAYS